MSEDRTSAAAARTSDWARWRPWLVAGLSLWLVVGIALVDRANRAGQVADVELSPSHVVAYAGLLVLAGYVMWAFFRGLRRGRWRSAFPPGYGSLGLGFAAAVAWIVLDSVWRSTLGITNGIENGLAPPRLLIPVVVALAAWGPIREALGQGRASLRTAAPAVVAAAVATSALTLTVFNPVREPWNDRTLEPGRDMTEIWTMAPDGSGQTRVIAALETGIDYSLPAWSPDGNRIAYTRWINEPGVGANVGFEEQTAEIWTIAADGSDATRVVQSPHGDQAWIPAWSPDGAWIAYTISGNVRGPGSGTQPQAEPAPGPVGLPTPTGESHLWIVHPDGTEAHAITSGTASTINPVWSPDGTRLAFISGLGTGASDIHVARFEAGAITDEQPLAVDLANDWAPAWSPDGSRIVFVSNRAGSDDIWTMRADGSDLAQLTTDGAFEGVPVFSTDGSRIVFVADRAGDIEIWSMAADGTDLRNLSNSPGTDDGRWSVGVSPADGRLAFARSAWPIGAASDWVRFDLAAATTLLWAMGLAIAGLLLVGLGEPFGGFAVLLGIVAVIAAIPTDEWQFVPAAVVAGAVVDILVSRAPPARRGRVAAAGLAGLGALALSVTLAVTGANAWSLTLLLGVALGAALAGWAVGEVVRRLAPAPV